MSVVNFSCPVVGCVILFVWKHVDTYVFWNIQMRSFPCCFNLSVFLLLEYVANWPGLLRLGSLSIPWHESLVLRSVNITNFSFVFRVVSFFYYYFMCQTHRMDPFNHLRRRKLSLSLYYWQKPAACIASYWALKNFNFFKFEFVK